MARADFLERVRRYSFLLTLVGNEYRGVYNSAWIGMLMTIWCSTWLSLVGFYIVKNSIRRDSDTRVGQILAATPMPKAIYTLAKTLSNFAVLACMVLVLMLAALAMQFLRPRLARFLFGSFGRRLFWLRCPQCYLPPAWPFCLKLCPSCAAALETYCIFFSG